MKRIYYLSTCNTCQRIMKEIDLPASFERVDIKDNPIDQEQLEDLVALSGDHESIFNRRAKLYQVRNLKNKNLSEEDYRNLILEHYTFLKRPIIICENQIFIGNNRKTVEAVKNSLQKR